jgi:serine palmitoyltransferase
MVPAITKTLEDYTLGSCGPRGFYGSTRKHLELEDSIAKFLGTQESITYSDSVAAIASAIPAFSKRGDILLIDAGVNHAIQMGARLSRSQIAIFRHNDLADLRLQLEFVRSRDKARRDKSHEQRRFIVVEGLYANFGDRAPLAGIVALAKDYCWRVIVDDSMGFGVLGKTGRGAVEDAGLSLPGVDVLLGSMATSLSSVGGFCVGSREVVDHQRLSGAGYCFSASAPPYLCAAATNALSVIQNNPDKAPALQERAAALHSRISNAFRGTFRVLGEPISPVKHCLLNVGGYFGTPFCPAWDQIFANNSSTNTSHVSAPTPSSGSALPGPSLPAFTSAEIRTLLQARVDEERILSDIVRRLAAKGVLLSYAHYLSTDHLAPRPTLKFLITLSHSEEEIETLLKAISAVAQEIPAVVAEYEALKQDEFDNDD